MSRKANRRVKIHPVGPISREGSENMSKKAKSDEVIISALADEVRSLRYLLSELKKQGVFNDKDRQLQLTTNSSMTEHAKVKAFDEIVEARLDEISN